MSRKQEQLAAAIKRGVQTALAKGLSDPRYSGLVTVTEVIVSPDGIDAFIRVSVLPHDRASLTMHALRHATEHIRREVGDMVRVRRMPRFEFRLDDRSARQAETMAAIARVREELEAADAPPNDADTPARADDDPDPPDDTTREPSP